MIYPVVRDLAARDIPVATAGRVLKVSTSGYYAWVTRPASPRDLADAYLSNDIVEIHRAAHGTYGARRVHAELALGQGVHVGRKRVERLMHGAGRQGIHRRRLRGCTRRDKAAVPSQDLVLREFNPAEPDRLYVADITQHPTTEGWYYLAVVLDCFSRRVVGWAMADHLRSELVVDALQMAIWQRRPAPGAIHHSDHGSQYTSWAFGHRLRDAGLLGSMGTIGDCYDCRGKLLRNPPNRTPRPVTVDDPPGTRSGRVRLRRNVLQPPPQALDPRLPQPRRLRERLAVWTPHRDRSMITITQPQLSAEPGALQWRQWPTIGWCTPRVRSPRVKASRRAGL